jgi:hypothetical protein
MNGTGPMRAGSRGLHWLPAFVLFVLLAGAGLPTSAGGVLVEQRIEASSEHEAAHRRVVIAWSERDTPSRTTARRSTAPRPQPRTRSVAARGLPPARAPTA